KEAQEALKEQIENAKSLDDQKSLAISWNSLGELLKKERKLDEAQQAFETVINISQNFKDQYFLAAWALHNLGIIYKSKKEFKTAEKFLKESVEIFKDNNYLPGLTKVMSTLGSVLEKQQKWKEAKKVLEESYSFAEKLGDELGQAIIANSLGQVMAHLEEDEAHERSFMYFNQSIKLGKKLNNEPHLAKVYTARGKIFFNRGHNERAVEELSQGFEIDVKLGNIRGLRIIIPSITNILSRLGKQEEALAYCERALKVDPNNTSFQELYHKIQRAIANGKRYAKQISVIEEEEDDDW
ncbi:MAG: tetratricopeptide repeat protein, partial [Trichodesmium sp. MAG_R02]|nr:tetratricopeptide repeat protein [Trichodesmium sp. MAG_R02]